MSQTMPIAPAAFSVSPAAAARIAEIVAQQGTQQAAQEGIALRVAVESGGCNGFQYSFRLDARRAADDVVIEAGDATVIVDPVSMDLLRGAELQFVDKLMGAHFTVANPNAATSCGCGTSFSLA
ncbi:HesB/IscA family protein [Acidomonas methanolica]|uniref:HesB/IscA family protein n=1 Tax=Acidomonas methanolica TaxID=437 RepID=UPI002119D4A3|nr:iron-sulfur cluster assembly accessory protein [Acidomonas methanolica]MCQ9155032.1 iron-sulfur cluster assembly accessory protein [Acidomonas methanolica]